MPPARPEPAVGSAAVLRAPAVRDRCCTFAVDGIDSAASEGGKRELAGPQDNCPRPLDELRDWTGEEVDMWDSGVIITPAEVAGTEDTLVQVIVCVDPKMSVPRWLINVAVRNFCFLVMLQVRRAVAATRLPEHLRVTTDPENSFYAFIRRRMAESLPTQLALAPPVAGSPEAAPGRAGASLGAWCGEERLGAEGFLIRTLSPVAVAGDLGTCFDLGPTSLANFKDGGAHPGTARWAWLALLMAALAALAARYFA
ncbi:unnamed protein product [Prorocentrum cordatum]|uniref:Uncharacterized protein n=1 Tax=Prorocentrum cordatum TaxID=2364126 RepID=A0ABN9TPU2_9DINO|nr:unnamed protein product [Polarella glacialis]